MNYKETLTENIKMKHNLRPLEGFVLKTKLDVLHLSHVHTEFTLKAGLYTNRLKHMIYMNVTFKLFFQVSTCCRAEKTKDNIYTQQLFEGTSILLKSQWHASFLDELISATFIV